MKKSTAILAASSLLLAPLATGAPSILEAVEAAASSGAWRPQNTATITTGRIQDDDKKRSAIAFAISGAAAFAGAGLWYWIPCRDAREGSGIGGLRIAGYNKCYDADGERRPPDTPVKLLLGAGVGLELVSLFYLIAHLRQDGT